MKVPFLELHGESTEYVGRAEDAIIALSNYRLHIKFKESLVNVSDYYFPTKVDGERKNKNLLIFSKRGMLHRVEYENIVYSAFLLLNLALRDTRLTSNS